ncbi:MAG: TlpA disulfide reductase family protein [Acidobacteriota bacterium]
MNVKALNLSRPKAVRTMALAAAFCLLAAGASMVCVQSLYGQEQRIVWSPQQKAIVKRIKGLRQLPDRTRGHATKQLALEIRQLPASENKVQLALGLASLSTEGDPGGRETLQAVTTTLADALRDHPLPPKDGQPAMAYSELASLVQVEHMQASLQSPEFAAAMAQLKEQDQRRRQANFTLTDLQGRKWTLKDLRGKVVLVNFWATWCPPCRKETPDLESLYKRFKGQGFVVLGISDQAKSKVQPFARKFGVTYPLLLDPGRKVNKLFSVEGIPVSFVYNRQGKLVAQSMDMRTRKQFLAMLAKAGLK